MYELKIKPDLDKRFKKMRKRELGTLQIIDKKVQEIRQNPQHYKNLRKPLEDWKSVHIFAHFVLVFSVDENTKTVTLEDYDHHDYIYKKKR